MSKIATNRTNFKYASELKKRGFQTAVHALPPEAKSYVDEMLAKQMNPVAIANELLSRYGKEIIASGLKPISHASIRTYRDKYFTKTSIFKKGVIGSSVALQEEADKIVEDFDALKEMTEMAKVQKGKAKLADTLEDKTKLPSNRGDESRRQFFDMAQIILDKEMELGLRNRAPIQIDSTLGVDVALEDNSSLIAKGKKAIEAIEKGGRYAKRESTGQRLGSASKQK